MKVGGGAGQVTTNGSAHVNISEGGLAGVLQAGSLVMNSGDLVFNHTDATTFSAAISGSGTIKKTGGSGDTTLVNVSSFTGSFNVQGGRMILQGNTNARRIGRDTVYSCVINPRLRHRYAA